MSRRRTSAPFFGRNKRRNRRRVTWRERLSQLLRRRRPMPTRPEPELLGAAEEAALEAAAGLRRSRLGPKPRMVLVLLGWAAPLAVAVVAFATPLLGVRAYHYVQESEHFHVADVVIDGHERLPLEEVSELAGIVAGTNVLDADLDIMAARLQAHPWIAKATLTRELPDTLQIRIVEHRPVAFVAIGELYLIDSTGEPFAVASGEDQLDLPIITGIEPELWTTSVGAELARSDVRSALNLARQYHAMGLSVRWPLAEVRVEPGRRLTLVISEHGTEAVVGRAPYRDKLYRLEWVLENLHRRGKVAEYVLLDLQSGGDWARDEGRVVVKADLAPTREQLAERAASRARRLDVEPPAPDPATPSGQD